MISLKYFINKKLSLFNFLKYIMIKNYFNVIYKILLILFKILKECCDNTIQKK